LFLCQAKTIPNVLDIRGLNRENPGSGLVAAQNSTAFTDAGYQLSE